MVVLLDRTSSTLTATSASFPLGIASMSCTSCYFKITNLNT